MTYIDTIIKDENSYKYELLKEFCKNGLVSYTIIRNIAIIKEFNNLFLCKEPNTKVIDIYIDLSIKYGLSTSQIKTIILQNK